MVGISRKLGRVPGFTLIELMIVVAIIGILAAIAIPSFVKYIRRTRTTEALMNLRVMFTGAVAYYDGEHFDRTGVQYPAQFPGTVAITPAVVPPGKAVLTPPSDWAHPTWQALNFSLSDPHYFSYAFTSTGTEKAATCTMDAYGDLNGDGVYGLMSRIATVDTAGNVVGAYGIYFNEEIH